MIIGLTGSMGCGKGEIVNILQKKGFEYITLSSMVREEARLRGIPEEREKLMEVGNSMRAEGGVGILAKKALQKIVSSAQDKWVVDGIRNPAEIDELKLNNKKVYIYGKSKDSGERIDAFPCFICKKMLINCGLKRVICSLKNGEFIVFKVQDWIDEWAENDIVDDKFQYGEATRVK